MRFGYPISGERHARGGRRVYFQHGSITWNATIKETSVVETPASP